MNLTISVDSLLKLPEGATYRESHDRAHVEARQRDGVIYITGTCDSLERQVEYYATLYHTARDALENQSRATVKAESTQRPNPTWLLMTTFILGLALGAITTIFIIVTQHKNE